MQNIVKISVTGAIVLVAATAVFLKYRDYLENPWTRDAQVRANVIEIAPRVSAPIVNLAIIDNQFVRQGDLLFELDPRTFQAAYDQAFAKLESTVDELDTLDRQVEAARASVAQYGSLISQAQAQLQSAQAQLDEDTKQFERYRTLVEDDRIPEARFDVIRKNRDVSAANVLSAEGRLLQARAAHIQAQANLDAAIAKRGAVGDNNPRLREAKAAVTSAKLNLDFTKVYAPVDGFISNLQIRLGSQAVENQPIVALIDSNSFWIDAYFRETSIARISPGDRAAITLMQHPDIVVPGTVHSIGRGIAKSDGSSGTNLLPNVSPTFDWIRLAQRIPVRIEIASQPEGVDLRVGTTASVLVMTRDSEGDDRLPPPAPTVLQ